MAHAHSLLAYQALSSGLNKLEVNHTVIANDLDQHWEVLAEPIQTVLRAHGFHDAYEQLKTFSQGKPVSKASIHAFIAQLALPEQEKARLLALTPSNYTGLAAKLASDTSRADNSADTLP